MLVCGVGLGLGLGLGVGWVEYYLKVTRWGQEINQEVCEFGKNKNFEMTILPITRKETMRISQTQFRGDSKQEEWSILLHVPMSCPQVCRHLHLLLLSIWS